LNKLVVLLACLALAGSALGQTWTNGPQSTFAYMRFDGEYFPGTAKVYFLGGRVGYLTTLGDIYSYTPLTGAYADVGVNMPVAVSNYDICLLRDDHDLSNGDTFGLYIVGGRYDAAPNYLDSVQVYYPTSNTAEVLHTDAFPGLAGGWITVAQSAIAYNNLMYVFGGFSDSGSATSAQAWLFDPLGTAGSRWSQLADMPLARAYPIAAIVDSFLFACGGDTWQNDSLLPRAQCQRLNLNDTAAGWTLVANMPVPTSQARAFGFDSDLAGDFAGDIIVAGRAVWPSESADCYIYDVASDSWDTFPSLAQRRRNHAGVYIPPEAGGTGVPGIWVFGGRQDLDTLCLQISEYYVINPIGAEENSGAQVGRGATVTPNPSRGQATIHLGPGAGGKATLKVFDVLGKEVCSGRSDRGSFVVKGLAAGTYVVRLETKNGKEETKFVVTR